MTATSHSACTRSTSAIARLQRLAGLPAATTNMGKGSIDEAHGLAMGVIGNTMGSRSPTKFFKPYIQEADLVIFVGTRTNENGTAAWSLFPESAHYVQIDVDADEIGRNYPAMRLLGDARSTVEAVCDLLEGRIESSAAKRLTELMPVFAEARASYTNEIAPYVETTASPMRPERIVAELGRQVDDTIWVADASYSSLWLVHYIQSAYPGTRFITPRGLAGLGWGFPMAIGARLASPGTRVVCLTGDGGFAHCWAELETARRHGVALTILVLNNGVLGFQINSEESRYGTHTDVCHFGPIDHVAIARACGCQGRTVESVDQLRVALDEAASFDGPFVIDARTDPSAFPPLTAFESQLDSAAM
jgi:acetolactate synthase-1/2/3 large subunit